MASLSLPPLSVYYCYDPVDLDFCKALDIHLDPLKRRGWIYTWDDQQILAGAERERERNAHLQTARLLILLISADFLASDSGVGMIQVALQRQRDGEAVVIPILVRAANWEETDLHTLQVLPREQKAILSWQNQDDIWREITRELQQIIQTMRQWIFVAASPQDQTFVEQLRQDILSSGVLLWSQEEGHNEAGRDAMRTASAVILIASPDAPSSRLVKAQLALAADYQRPILVVWARGEDWKTSNPGNWQVHEVVDVRGRSYETARKILLIRLRQVVATLPPLVYPESHTEPRNPYKGLHAFTSDDAGDFFGRGALIDELATTVEALLSLEKQGGQPTRLLPVIGPSGSGKSSVVMAGLLPCLKSEGIIDSREWVYLQPIFPGAHPLESLAVSFAAQFPARSVLSLNEDFASDSARALHLLACQLVHPSQRKVVLVVDQFEELFTLTSTDEERQHFLDLLVTAVTEPCGPVLAILTLRADFYDRLMQYPEFYRLFDKHHISVLPMGSDDLRMVIEQPAHLSDVQLTFDGNLVGDLLFEMQGQAGALPLLQFTLDQLFQQRDGHLLSLQVYHEIGGIKGALSQHAEVTYKALPSDEHRRLARDIFLRLIKPGITEQDTTRRRAALSEFDLAEVSGKQQTQETLDAFIQARLLTTNKDRSTVTVEVSHEALIREWKRLAAWLREARADILFQQSLSEDVAEWEQRERPRDRLYRGVQFKEAQGWASRNRPSKQEAAFLQASAAQQTLQFTSIVVVVLLLISSIATAGWFVSLNRAIHPDPTLVTTLQDNVNGSLRYCVESAPEGSTIRFAQGLHGTIDLKESLSFSGGKHLTIQGPGSGQLTIRGASGSDANIIVPPGTTLTLAGLSFKNSRTLTYAFIENEGVLTVTQSIISNNDELAGALGYGGAITNNGTLTVSNSTLSGNTARSLVGINQGGSIENNGKLTVVESTFSQNKAVSNSGSTLGSSISSNGGSISNNGGQLTVVKSIFSQNTAVSSTGGAYGGGILNVGTMTVSESTFSGNSSSGKQHGQGGGIENDGKLTVAGSTFSQNTAVSSSGGGYGGGILNVGAMTVSESTFSGNSSSGKQEGQGGGIENDGKLTVVGSTFSQNTAVSSSGNSFGGGILNTNGATMTVSESTFSGNSSSGKQEGRGGGIENDGKLTVAGSTFSQNTSVSSSGNSFGGGIYNCICNEQGTSLVRISGSIIAANTAAHGSDISGVLISDGYNLLTNIAGVSGLNTKTDRQVTIADLKLDTMLRNNGGPTQTLALLPGSPAIDAVPLQPCHITFTDAFGQAETITTDQRGDPRPDGSENACDIGAYESSY